MIAVVVAADRYAARDALDLIEVDYEPLPVVSDPIKAVEKDSALAHPELGTNVAFTWKLANGDVEGAFQQADRIVRPLRWLGRDPISPVAAPRSARAPGSAGRRRQGRPWLAR